MDENTTTATPAEDTGATPAQPDRNAFGESAVTSPEQTTTEPQATPEASTDVPTDENVAWLTNKGIDPSDPEAIAKVAKMYRDAEKAMHEARQPKLTETLETPVEQADELIEAPDEVSQLRETVERMQRTQAVKDFMHAEGNAELQAERKALEPDMVRIVTENPAIKQMVNSGYMSHDQLLAMAKGSNPDYASNLKQDGGREALQTVANKQQARATPGVATTTQVAGETKADPFLAGFNSI